MMGWGKAGGRRQMADGRWQEEGIYKGQITIYLYIPQNNIARTLPNS
jgi:hypothetical protein